MTATSLRNPDRLDELLADEAAAALEAADASELDGLLARGSGVARDELMQAAALAQVAFLRRAARPSPGSAGARSPERMPAGLKERLASQGEALALRQRGRHPANPSGEGGSPPVSTGRAGPTGTSVPAVPARAAAPRRTGSSRGILGGLGWALAAALAVAFVVVRNETPTMAPPPDPVSARVALIGSAPDVVTLPWAAPTAEGYQSVTGDVVWSQSRQQGYLRLANMPVNDPARTQYQLWIVDPERDTHPVDGGVFNVSARGEVVIPIQAKLRILTPRAFAITAERPGGVVVSAGPLLVVAST